MLIIKIINYLNNFYLCIYCCQVIQYGILCIHCWKLLVFYSNKFCSICSSIRVTSYINECCECNTYVKTIFVYNNLIKYLILYFKYANKFFIGEFFIKFLIYLYIPQPIDNLIILYVPHYFSKQITTSLNSSLILAYEFQKKFGGTILHNILKKITKKRQKDTKSYKERLNSYERFKLNDKNQHLIKNKHIVLIDDVLTTGSTINTCYTLIKKAEVLSIQVFTLAKI